jgi:ATP-dependent exoDNAse (exonuclease V) beta subunit
MSDILELQPPPFVERFQYQSCKQINDPVTKKRVYLTPDGEKLPSVTTILSATKDMTHLNEWKKRVGEQKAQQIVTEASGIGTAMHSNLERFIAGLKRQPGNNPVHVQANAMADIIINNGLKDVNEVWAMEQSLYVPGLYSGTTDLVAVYKGNPSICDYKQTNKPKKEEWVEDYKMQLVAYILAHNAVYKTNIREGHVFMCSRDLQYQQFDLWPKDYDEYEEKWLKKVEEYYGLN